LGDDGTDQKQYNTWKVSVRGITIDTVFNLSSSCPQPCPDATRRQYLQAWLRERQFVFDSLDQNCLYVITEFDLTVMISSDSDDLIFDM
jgi:hypothetical protein